MHICDRSLATPPHGRHDGGVDLDPAHLRSFLAIVDYGGYHRAAEALHLTQPAVSRHMRRLEGQLGEPLFAKRGRGVELTPYGERAAQELRDVLAAHDRALARLGRGDDGDPFVLGTIENLVDPVLPELIAAARAELGERTLQLRVDRSASLVERLRRGEVDAAIVLDPGDAPDALTLGNRRAALVGQRPAGRRRPAARGRSRSSPTTRRAACASAPCAAWTSSASITSSPPRARTSAACRARCATAWATRCSRRAATGCARSPAARWPRRSPPRYGSCSTPRTSASVTPLRAALWRATMRRGLPEAA